LEEALFVVEQIVEEEQVEMVVEELVAELQALLVVRELVVVAQIVGAVLEFEDEVKVVVEQNVALLLLELEEVVF
jgi:hypothetical protein